MRLTFSNKPSFYSGPWGFVAQVVVMTLATLLATWILPGVTIDSVGAAVITAIVIALLNSFIRPILIVLTLPFTIFSMGLFIFIINAFIIMMAAGLIDKFHVNGFGSALLFSLLLTLFNYLLEIPNRITRRPKYKDSPQSPGADSDGFSPYEEISDEE